VTVSAPTPQPSPDAAPAPGRPLTGTIAMVTGASSGIGAATARHLAALGASVALIARRTDRLETVADAIHAEGGTAVPITADITELAQAGAAVTATVDAFGRIDILVNNAGVMLLGPIVDAPLTEWERMISLNIQGHLYIAHAALPHLLASAASKRGTADIVNITSVAGRIARNGLGVYNLTKHGITAFTESLRQEVSARHIRVSLVEPGNVDTELASHLRPEIAQAIATTFSNPTRLQADDIADAITYIVTRPPHVVINELLLRPDGAP
jgi:NADP-dependent 3-hydroxy acid dehydrogenase YdfG